MHSFSPFNNPGSFLFILTHKDVNFPHIVHILCNSNYNPHHFLGRNKEIDFKTDKLVTHMLIVTF